MQRIEKDKLKWYLLLFVAVIFFLAGMVTQNILLNLIAIILSTYIYVCGNPILFKEYDDKRQKKVDESKIVKDAVKEVINSGKLFKKK